MANSYGGGIVCYYSNPTISDCTISNNEAEYGGGIYCDDGSPTITGCTISDNTANSYGGGIYFENSSNPTITACTISGNTSGSAGSGGGIYCYQSNPTIASTLVCGNFPNQIEGNHTDGGGNTIQAVCSGVCCTNDHCVTAELGATQSECLKYFGQWFAGGDCNDCSPHLAGDLDGDGDVDADDLNALHDELGIELTDVNNNGCVDIDDLLLVIEDWNEGCTP